MIFIVRKPKESILHEATDRVDDFMHNYEYHKNIALKLYDHNGGRKSHTHDTLFYVRRLFADKPNCTDKYIESNYTCLWEKYIKDSYSERGG